MKQTETIHVERLEVAALAGQPVDTLVIYRFPSALALASAQSSATYYNRMHGVAEGVAVRTNRGAGTTLYVVKLRISEAQAEPQAQAQAEPQAQAQAEPQAQAQAEPQPQAS